MKEIEVLEQIQQRYEKLESQLRGKYATAPSVPFKKDKGRYEHADKGLSEEERKALFVKPQRDYDEPQMAECCYYSEGMRQMMRYI